MASVKPRPGILSLRPHMIDPPAQGPEPGIRIASNESAFGPSPGALRAAEAALPGLARYVEDAQTRLAAAIATAQGLDAECVVCGHGSDDLLARLARAFLPPGTELIYSVNGYQKIPNYAHANDAVPVPANDRDFVADVDTILEAVTPRTRMVMIANPDNPTGSLLSGTEVRRLHAELPDEVLLVLDSAYAEYVDAPDYERPDRLVEEFDNIAMTRTFSKIHGLAGARVGWLYAAPAVADAVRRIGITFPLSGPSFAAACAALEDQAHLDMVFSETRRLRSEFGARLSALGLQVYPSQTNFLLVRFPDPARPAAAADDFLLSRGIQARRFAAASFADCIRFTIGLESEMAATAAALEDFMRLEGAA